MIDIVFHLSGYNLEAATGWVADQDLGALHLRAGAELDVSVHLDEKQAHSFRIEHATARVTWRPPSSCASFRVIATEDAALGTTFLRVEVSAGGILLCYLYVQLVTDSNAPTTPRRRYSFVRKLPRDAFASYASVDRNAVCERLESIQSLGIDVFIDCLDIRQGANWQLTLGDAVISKDIFMLFWSTAARRSPWVKLEWQSALAARGIDYIVPNALEPVHLCPPPAELASLQFGSRFAIAREPKLEGEGSER